MAGFDYGAMTKIASGLLADFNQGEKTLIKKIKGAGPGYDPSFTEAQPIAFKGVARGVQAKYVNTGLSLPAGLAIATDLQVTCDAVQAATAEMGDIITLDGKRHTIVQIITIPPAGTAVVRVFIVRAG